MKMPTVLQYDGHVYEGLWTPMVDGKTTFDGELICGPHDESGGHVEKCSQCGGEFSGRACGPTHAVVARNRSMIAG